MQKTSVNWTVIWLAIILVGGWMAWQSFSSMGVEARGFLNGMLTGAFTMLLVAVVVVALILRQQQAVIRSLEQQIARWEQRHDRVAHSSREMLPAPERHAPENPYSLMAPPLPLGWESSPGEWTSQTE